MAQNVAGYLREWGSSMRAEMRAVAEVKAGLSKAIALTSADALEDGAERAAVSGGARTAVR